MFKEGTNYIILDKFPVFLSFFFHDFLSALMRMLTVQPHLITDKEYLEHTIKYAIDCGVIDQWLLGRERGFPPKEDTEEVVPDPDGIRSLTEMEYRTLESVS